VWGHQQRMKYNKLINLFILFLSVFLICLQVWLDRYFGEVDIEQFIIFISFGINGLLDTEDYIINKFIEICLYFPTAFILLYIVLFNLIFLFDKKHFKLNLSKKINKYQILFSVLLFSFSIFNLSKNMSVKDFLSKDNDHDFIKENYTKPDLKNFQNVQTQQDLVLIYLESIENSFLNNNFISKSSIENFELKSFNAKGFPEFNQTKYNNWTIGSIISTQCGVPQKPIGIIDTRRKGFQNFRNVFGLKNFLPNIHCLGDLLKLSNYHNVFINAVDLNFQAMGTFFGQHGYDELIGKKYFDNLYGPSKSLTWGGGVNDSKLFELAKKRIIKLKQEKKRFNVTLLTTDTHEPGYIDDNCNINFEEETIKLARAIDCTSYELNKFVKFIYDNYPNDTSIVIMGDHLHTHLELYTVVESKRFIYNKIISKNINLYRENINHFDFFPTILNILNFNSSDKLGLGYTAVKKINLDFYNAYIKNLEKNIGNKSDYYNEFWK